MIVESLFVLAATVTSVIVSVALAGLAYRRRDAPAAATFLWLQVVAALWGIGNLLVYVGPAGHGVALAGFDLRTVASAFTGVLSVLFLGEYTQSRLLTGRRVSRLLLGAAAVYSLVWLWNPAGLAYASLETVSYGGIGLVDPTLGPATAAFLLGVVLALTVALAGLVRFAVRSARVYRTQAAVVAVGFLVVTVGTVATVAFNPLSEGVDLTIVLQAFTGTIVGLAVYRLDFLSVVPPAKDAVVDEIEDPVIVLDGDDGIAYVNAAAGAVLGVAEADLGRPVDAVVEGLTDTVRAGELYRHADDAVATDGGSELVFDPAESPVRDHRGVERGRAIVLRDVTEQKRREELLEQFARSLSHDLRNPLTVAHGNVELARETGEGDLSALDDVEASLERMEEMVDGLLAASRPADDPDLVPVRLSTVARDAWETVHTGDATLTHAGTDRSLFASRRHLRQILENLFRNAVEHNDEPVTVTVERTETGFVVADDGIGIPVEEQDAVFDRGYTTADSGTGLGLDIVAHLCRRHGWTVSAAESDAGGTAFVVETGG